MNKELHDLAKDIQSKKTDPPRAAKLLHALAEGVGHLEDEHARLSTAVWRYLKERKQHQQLVDALEAAAPKRRGDMGSLRQPHKK